QIEKNSIQSLNSLKSLESDCDPEIFGINSDLEILSLKFQTLNIPNRFKMLKFLNIRCYTSFTDINFLNDLSELEFLDFELPNNLNDTFKFVTLTKLKFLILKCENPPKFNVTLKNLQGLEIIGSEDLARDQFVNLLNLDYLAISYPDFGVRYSLPCFLVLKNLKYFKFEIKLECTKYVRSDNSIYKLLFKMFQEPNKVEFRISDDDDRMQVLEMNTLCADELISEKVYFKKVLQVSECVREFILSSESSYFRECFRNTKSRRSNFVLAYKNAAADSDDESSFKKKFN
ncbi:unnamed protein product, partial [Brachionus calyciflorus]